MVKNLPADAGDLRDAGLIPGSGRSPGEGHGDPLVFLPGESHPRRDSRGERSPWLPLETRPDSPGVQNCELRCLAAPSPRPRGAIYLLAWEPFRAAGLGSAGSGGRCAGCGAAWLGVSLGLTIIYQVCDLGETLRLLSFSFLIYEMGPKMTPTVSGASDKEPTYQRKRLKRCRFDPWVQKLPWRRA